MPAGAIRPILRANATAEKPAAGDRSHDGARPMGAAAPRGPRSAGRSPCPLPGRACAAGNPKSYAMKFDRTSTAAVSRASRDARMVIETSPPTDAPAVPTAGVLHPTRDIHARVRRCNVHVKRQKSRVERLPIRPLRTPALKLAVGPNADGRKLRTSGTFFRHVPPRRTAEALPATPGWPASLRRMTLRHRGLA